MQLLSSDRVRPPALAAPDSVELSVVMPCLDEVETLGRCIVNARAAFVKLGIAGEIVVADNGSRDGSPELARQLGARVVHVAERGYGAALRAGIAAARGRYVAMGDSDDSYDFSELSLFVERLRDGADLVMGNRFRGGIADGAMPWKHRWIGNPVLTGIGRLLFRSPVGDFHCGLRAFTREAFGRMQLETSGMEFASEMVIRATMLAMNIAEVPVVLRKDGRSRAPHLRSWRDGWRHLRFMLLLSPTWLFLAPGALLLALGALAAAALLPGARSIGDVQLDIHTLLVACCVALSGTQCASFAFVAKRWAIAQGLLTRPRWFARLERLFSLERGLLVGGVLFVLGVALVGWAAHEWAAVGFGRLTPRLTMRKVCPGAFLSAVGLQVVFTSFLGGILDLRPREPLPRRVGLSS